MADTLNSTFDNQIKRVIKASKTPTRVTEENVYQ